MKYWGIWTPPFSKEAQELGAKRLDQLTEEQKKLLRGTSEQKDEPKENKGIGDHLSFEDFFKDVMEDKKYRLRVSKVVKDLLKLLEYLINKKGLRYFLISCGDVKASTYAEQKAKGGILEEPTERVELLRSIFDDAPNYQEVKKMLKEWSDPEGKTSTYRLLMTDQRLFLVYVYICMCV